MDFSLSLVVTLSRGLSVASVAIPVGVWFVDLLSLLHKPQSDMPIALET